MIDRVSGMDLKHSKIVIKEIAKLHATSFILANTLKNQTIIEKYPFLETKWMNYGTKAFELFKSIISNGVSISSAITRQLNDYKEQNSWLETHKNKLIDVYLELLNSSPENMKVINHGDCWNNNLLYRYDDIGHPIEATLLDFQICRFGSLGLDLNYFLYCSHTGDARNKYTENFLSVYYEEFENVMKSNSTDMPFTRNELQEEVLNKTLFGIISAIMDLPFIICEDENAPDLSNMAEESNKGENSESSTKLLSSSPALKTRFLSVFDDMKTKGILLGHYDAPSP
ncbi:UNVERIFIED_CONTAM: hypothetical protein GTU68_017253 [Idotea baltica]|nr:hypothetical protein [Idotea baltica]